MRFAKILALLFFVAIIYQLIGVYNTTAYETSFVRESASTSVINSSSAPFLILATNGYCNDSLISYVSGVGSNYYLNSEYWIPTNNLLGTSSRTFTNNNCSYNGKFDKLLTNNVSFKSRFYGAFSASYIDIFLRDNITCFADSIKMTNNGFYNGNTNLNLPYTYYISLFKNESVLCFTPKTFYQIPTAISHYGSYYWEDVFIYPFNSGLGNVNINVTNDGTNPKTWYYYQANSISSPTLIGTGAFSAHYILMANTDYVLYGYKHFSNTQCTSSPCTVSIPNAIIDIDTRLPNIECGVYGDCINGTKQRLCHDLNGFIPDYLEFEICYSAPDVILNIGFEDSINANVFYSQPTWFWPICPMGVNEKSVEYPKDWNVNTYFNPMINNTATSHVAYIFDNIKMTNEGATQGIKSLKLWYLPPQQYLPQCNNGSEFYTNGTQCVLTAYGNYSIGNAPQIERDINETWLVSKNLTFNYPNITLLFDARKCSSPEQEWSGNSSLFGTCGEGYYTNDKSPNWPISNTMIYYSIYDYNISTTVYIGSGEAKTNLWNTFELLLMQLDTTHLYQLQINLLLSSELTSNVYCAMIDNVNINAYSGAVHCSSYCDDERNYHALVSQNQYGCSFTVTEMSPKCFDLSISPLISGCSPNICPICEIGQPDYLTLYSGDNSTGVCIWTFTENSDYCVNYCSTQKLISDNPLAQDIAIYFQFFNPIWIITFIIMGIGAFLAYKIKDWHVFAISVIVGFLISAVVWIEMAFIAICIMIIVAYFMFKDMSSK